ncbi:hypothetical protein ACFE04_029903 [Oxalis oulophora]
MVSEITQENDEEDIIIDKEVLNRRIREIIQNQKSLYLSSSFSSSSSLCSSTSASSSSRNSGSLLEKMRGGGTSLRRLFDMEHTSLSNHFEDYSGSPVIKPIYLWGSDSDGQVYDPWESMEQIRASNNDRDLGPSSDDKYRNGDSELKVDISIYKRKLKRKKSFRRLPRFGFWRFRGFRLRKLKIILCGRKFLC